jgi:phosphatidate phosphatase APP1
MGWFSKSDPLQIMPFNSFGTAERLYVRGRALEDEAIDLAQKGTIPLLINSWKRFESDEIRHAYLKLELHNGKSFRILTDDNGYFLIDEPVADLDLLADEEGWVWYQLSFDSAAFINKVRNNNVFKGAFLIPSRSAEYGIITDIDDTILHTGVTSYLKWKVIFNTLFKRAESRTPLQGASELYRRLHIGRSGSAANPVFYVSHSPWNLYRYLEYFLNRNHFPKGPILLRSMASVLWRQKKGSVPHKHSSIVSILNTYPDLTFLLIGDSGEKDADIYLDIARNYPTRIRAIFLRTVKHPGRMRRVKKLLLNFSLVPCYLVDHSDELAKFAREEGLL